jgi:hypothetical protein
MLIKVTDIPPEEAHLLFCTDRRLHAELRSLRNRKAKTVHSRQAGRLRPIRPRVRSARRPQAA